MEKLLLPILYVEPRGFSAESLDEAVALVAATQYEDWREARLLEPTSRAYRVLVNGLARRLVDIAGEVTQQQFVRELDANLDKDGTDGLADLMEEITSLLPDWLDAVMADPIIRRQISAIFSESMTQVGRLKRARSRLPVISAAYMRMAREMLPAIERNYHDAEIYLARSAQLDPLVSSIARIINEHPDSYPLVAPLREAIDEAMRNIRLADEQAKRRPEITDFFDQQRHLGRIFQKCSNAMYKSVQLVTEGNDIVRRWDAEINVKGNSTTMSIPGIIEPQAGG